ncbi:hypothetical protein CEXT_684431 [Caerostris extrusa]|uniref:Uncharacterized protein n=1 Tax=Caerostris extrusa TaxID=172846 RepID=A0AAV4XR91_CAEEX|nr:hypothetical protein CEXT_684431 [Caerostris extrusa]
MVSGAQRQYTTAPSPETQFLQLDIISGRKKKSVDNPTPFNGWSLMVNNNLAKTRPVHHATINPFALQQRITHGLITSRLEGSKTSNVVT